MGRRRPPAGTRTKLALLLGSVLFVVAVGELSIRVWFADEVDAAALRAGQAANVTRTFTRASDRPDLVFELRPGADVRWQQTRVTIDAEGASRIDPTRPPPENPDIRIALVGDSTAFGWGVEYAQSYGAVLEGLVAERSGRSVHVRNFAVPGNNSHHNRIAFRDHALGWRPHLAILHYDHNDAEAIDEQPHDYMGPAYGDNPLGSALFKWIARRLFAVKNRYFAWTELADSSDPNRYEGHFRYAGPQYDKHMRELGALADLAAQADVPLLALLYNSWLEASPDPERDPAYTRLHLRAARRLKAMGYEVLDTYPAAQALMRERGWSDLGPSQLSRADGHPNAEMHRWIAERLLEAIATRPKLAQRAGLSSR